MENKVVELAKKLEECKKELMNMGAYGCSLFDSGCLHDGKRISVQMSNENLPDSNAKYNTISYSDKVVKNIIVGDVCFFTLLTADEAFKEGVYWGPLI